MEPNRLATWILIAIASAAGAVYILPISWFIPIFVGSIAATLFCAIVARLAVKDDSPVNPIVDAVATVLSVPSRPLAKVPSGWALRWFLILAAFVVILVLTMMLRANA